MKTTRTSPRRRATLLVTAIWAAVAGTLFGADGDAARIVNIAARASIGGAAGTPIAGFVVSGTPALCPVTSAPLAQGASIPIDPARTDQFLNAVFRVVRYPPTYAGLAGRDLGPRGFIETY